MLLPIHSFADIDRVVSEWPHATKSHRYSMEHMHQLLDALGNPHQQLRVVHVAGTSGKTSTAYYVAALLQAMGKRVGLTISPHAETVNERVQINLQPLPEAEFAPRFERFLRLVRNSGVTPNYFELFMTMALWEFAARKVDYAVVEVGIGGLLDSTNVFTDPDKVCIITDIGLDHVQLLGNTLAAIAEQKAGIIQLHNPVFCYEQGAEVDDVIRRTAAQKQADLHTLRSGAVPAGAEDLPLFAQRNFGLALAAARFVAERDGLLSVGEQALLRAAHTTIPARMEQHRLGDKTLIIDGAHNGQKMHALVASLRARFGSSPVAVLVPFLGMQKLMRLEQILHELSDYAAHVVVTTDPKLAEGGDGMQLAALCQKAGVRSFQIVGSTPEAFRLLTQRPEQVLLVTGSFYLLNDIRPLL